MAAYLDPNDLVTLRAHGESASMTVRDLALKLIVPVNKFFYDRGTLYNSCWQGNMKDMFWEWKRERDINSLEYLLNASLNHCIERKDWERLRDILEGSAWLGVGLIEQRLSAVLTLYTYAPRPK